MSEGLSPVAYYNRLARVAMGWLGWTEQQALSADVNAIEVAFDGRMEMLRAIFGDPKKQPPRPDQRDPLHVKALTPQYFDAMFAGSKPRNVGKRS